MTMLLAAVALMLFFALLSRLYDGAQWNHGRCKHCGAKWKRFATDSQGGHGYKCRNDHTVWITWGVDSKGIFGHG